MAVGETSSSGFQAGARRTFPLDLAEAWELITSPEAVSAWLGDLPTPLHAQTDVTLGEGSRIQMRVFTEGSHLRLSREWPGCPRPSTIQVRVLPARDDHAVIAFHEEHLPHAAARAERLAWFSAALDRLETLAYGRAPEPPLNG